MSGSNSSSSSSGGSATSSNTQTNGGGNGGASGNGESHFSTSTFDSFLSSNAGSDVYDSLMLEGSRPLILHSHLHANKGFHFFFLVLLTSIFIFIFNRCVVWMNYCMNHTISVYSNFLLFNNFIFYR